MTKEGAVHDRPWIWLHVGLPVTLLCSVRPPPAAPAAAAVTAAGDSAAAGAAAAPAVWTAATSFLSAQPAACWSRLAAISPPADRATAPESHVASHCEYF